MSRSASRVDSQPRSATATMAALMNRRITLPFLRRGSTGRLWGVSTSRDRLPSRDPCGCPSPLHATPRFAPRFGRFQAFGNRQLYVGGCAMRRGFAASAHGRSFLGCAGPWHPQSMPRQYVRIQCFEIATPRPPAGFVVSGGATSVHPQQLAQISSRPGEATVDPARPDGTVFSDRPESQRLLRSIQVVGRDGRWECCPSLGFERWWLNCSGCHVVSPWGVEHGFSSLA